MKDKKNVFAWTFASVMLLFSLELILWIPVRNGLDFRLADTRLSLETSRGRERKQQMEYDEVTRRLPEARAELAELQPRADAAAEQVKVLKERRKELRAEKKALEAAKKAEETVPENPETAGTQKEDLP